MFINLNWQLPNKYSEFDFKFNIEDKDIRYDEYLLIFTLFSFNGWLTVKLCKYDCNGNLTFLGVPYGSREYVNEFVMKRIQSLFKKIDHIKLIKSSFIKHNILRKLYDYNKIIYSLKVIDKYDEWMNEVNKLHLIISKLILVGVNFSKLKLSKSKLLSLKSVVVLVCGILNIMYHC